MASRSPRYVLRPGMTTPQLVCGFCYLPFYLVLLSLGLQLGMQLLGVEVTNFRLNALYFSINFVVILLVYHRFFWYSLRQTNGWVFLQTLILSIVFYYVANWLLAWLLLRLAPAFQNPNNANVTSLATAHFWPMAVFSVIFAPVVEETLVRGVVFGAFHRKSRIAAYAASILLFSIMHTWGYFGRVSLGTLAISALQYVPASLALGWAYEKSGSILTPMALHCFINAVSFGLIPLQ